MSFHTLRSLVARSKLPPISVAIGSSRPRLRTLGIPLAATLVAGIAGAQTQGFLDGTFGGTWTSTKIVDTTPSSGATFTSTSPTVGGNPTDYRNTSHTFGLGAIIVAHMNSAAVVDPTQVSVQSIDCSYDLNYFDASTVGGAVGYRFALLQAGTYYGTATDNIFANAWTGFSHTGLHASDFTLITGPGPANPDFSCTGAPITLGFISANSQGGSAPVTKDSGLDNWSAVFHVTGAVFSDASFAGWTSLKIVDTTPGSSATFVTTFPAAGGNPGAYMDTSHTFGLGAIVVNHANPAAVYNPSFGVSSLDYSYDLNHFTGVSVGGAVGYALSVVQGAGYYKTAYDNIFSNSWQSFAHYNVHASDFTLVAGSGPPNPDFSVLGAPLKFGVVSANSQGGSAPVTKDSGIDNWTLTIRAGHPCAGLGQSFCACDGNPFVGPCANNGLAGHGCENSSTTGGALLTMSGTVSPDTVVLNVTGLHLPGSTCVYYQGTTPISPINYGDGLRCVAGNLKRLYTKASSAGTSSAPGAGDPGIRVRSTQKLDTIPSPGTRYYFVAYRDPSSSFCPTPTGGFFNSSNAVSIIWP